MARRSRAIRCQHLLSPERKRNKTERAMVTRHRRRPRVVCPAVFAVSNTGSAWCSSPAMAVPRPRRRAHCSMLSQRLHELGSFRPNRDRPRPRRRLPFLLDLPEFWSISARAFLEVPGNGARGLGRVDILQNGLQEQALRCPAWCRYRTGNYRSSHLRPP